MPINMIIREKRKEIGLTQEQIAEYLGVSTPAVNKWEKGATYPDISLLPPLARLLKVDLNTLLCFNEEISEQEIDFFMKEVTDTIRKNGFDSGFTMGMEKVREYPNCSVLIHSAALVLDGALLMFGANVDNKEIYKNQITNLYERAAKSDDTRVRNKAIFMLASKYMGHEEYDKAQKMLDLLPEENALDKRKLQADLFIKQNRLEEAAGLLERKLMMTIFEIQAILMSLVEIALKEGNDQNASHIAKLSQEAARLFEQWDYSSFVAPLHVALAQKHVPESISLLKSILSAALVPWEMKSSSLYHHIPVKENQENFGTRILPTLLSELKNDPKYEFLYSSAEFKQLIEHYHTKFCS